MIVLEWLVRLLNKCFDLGAELMDKCNARTMERVTIINVVTREVLVC